MSEIEKLEVHDVVALGGQAITRIADTLKRLTILDTPVGAEYAAGWSSEDAKTHFVDVRWLEYVFDLDDCDLFRPHIEEARGLWIDASARHASGSAPSDAVEKGEVE